MLLSNNAVKNSYKLKKSVEIYFAINIFKNSSNLRGLLSFIFETSKFKISIHI